MRGQLAEDLLEAPFTEREDTACGGQDRANEYPCAWGRGAERARTQVDLQNSIVRSLDFLQNMAGGFASNKQRDD